MRVIVLVVPAVILVTGTLGGRHRIMTVIMIKGMIVIVAVVVRILDDLSMLVTMVAVHVMAVLDFNRHTGPEHVGERDRKHQQTMEKATHGAAFASAPMSGLRHGRGP